MLGGVFLACLVLVVPAPFDGPLWSLISLSAAVAAAVGLRRHRPAPAWPWWLLFAALAVSFVADVIWGYVVDVQGRAEPLASIADPFFLAVYPLLVVGVIGLSWAGGMTRDRALPLDMAVLATGLGLLAWIFLISPHLFDPAMSPSVRAVAVGYPIGDVLVLAVLGRLIIVHRFTPAVLLLTVGTAGLLVADVVSGSAKLNSHGPVAGPVDLGWLLFYAAWAAAALHPSMADLVRPSPTGPPEASGLRQAGLLVGSLLPVVLLLVAAAADQVGNTAAVATFAVAVVGLVGVRLFTVVTGRRRLVAREAVLRAAGVGLMAAHDGEDVRDVLAATVRRLLPAVPHTFLMIMNDGRVDGLFTGDTGAGARIVATGDLPETVGARLAPYAMTLRSMLVLDERPLGDPTLAAVLIGADVRRLSTLLTPVDTVTPFASLALERITLTREINRRDTEQQFRALIQNTTDVILIVEPGSLLIRYASPSARDLFDAGDLTGRPLLDTVAPADRERARRQLTTAPTGEPDTRDWTLTRPDGTPALAEVACQDLRDEPAIGGVVVTLRDVTAQRDLQAKLTYRAYHDSLTGLANRDAFQEHLDEAAERPHPPGTVTGMLFIDLDDFKIINDTAGHDHGDRLLRLVAMRLSSILHGNDTLARLGGDEFAVLIEDAETPADIEHTAERVITALAQPFTIDDRPVSGRASIGIATTSNRIEVPDLLRRADLALHTAKSEGKAQWRHHQPAQSQAIVARLNLRADLDGALTRGEFLLHFQPIVVIADGSPAGFEALVRWNHPTRGLLMPGQFIELAEESDTIIALGAWIMTKAAATAAIWNPTDTGAAPYVSVNVSARQFRTPGFADTVLRTLRTTALPAHRLMIEITESLILTDDDQVWTDLAHLREHGARIAIDDFGTGYSALSYLRHTPLDVLKLDRTFTRTITATPRDADLVEGIIKLADTLHLDVVAEGIEDDAERTLLQQFGCRYGQGYLYSRPMDTRHTTAWIDAHPCATDRTPPPPHGDTP